jgi:Zn-finger nucleic acid-binding protein
LQAAVVGGVPLDECAGCGGLWIQAEAFNRICNDREAQAAAIAMQLPLAVSQDDRVRYVKCPRCSQLMTRKSYAYRSGVVVDICREHGIWFDRDELRRIVEFIRAGGLELARQREKEELVRERQRLEEQRRDVARENARAGLASDTYRDGELAATLAAGLADVIRRLAK